MRFDHAVIAVRDLDHAMHRYRDLGFEVAAGGRHTGLGFHNAIISFGPQYVELLSVFDQEIAEARSHRGRELVGYLRTWPGGLIGYALATDHISEDAARLRAAGLMVEGPFGMDRTQPDGRLLSWQLCVPTGTAWRRPWPFLIQRDGADEGLTTERVDHPNQATSVSGLTLAVADLTSAVDLYERQFCVPKMPVEPVGETAARARFALDEVTLDVVAPTGGPVRQMLEERGEGLFQLTFQCRSLEQTHAALRAGNVPCITSMEDGRPSLVVPYSGALGAQLSFHSDAV